MLLKYNNRKKIYLISGTNCTVNNVEEYLNRVARNVMVDLEKHSLAMYANNIILELINGQKIDFSGSEWIHFSW